MFFMCIWKANSYEWADRWTIKWVIFDEFSYRIFNKIDHKFYKPNDKQLITEHNFKSKTKCLNDRLWRPITEKINPKSNEYDATMTRRRQLIDKRMKQNKSELMNQKHRLKLRKRHAKCHSKCRAISKEKRPNDERWKSANVDHIVSAFLLSCLLFVFSALDDNDDSQCCYRSAENLHNRFSATLCHTSYCA